MKRGLCPSCSGGEVIENPETGEYRCTAGCCAAEIDAARADRNIEPAGDDRGSFVLVTFVVIVVLLCVIAIWGIR